MKLELQVLGYYCSTDVFIINDIPARSRDFGDQGDQDPDNAEDYCCAQMEFIRIDPTPEVLAKYGITVPEYELIAGQLETELSFGNCGWCE